MSAIYSYSRISTSQLRDGSLANINNTQNQLLQIENQISTGNLMTQPSDNPANAMIAIQLQRTLNLNSAYSSNLSTAQSNLSQADSALSSVSTAVQQAITLAQSDSGSDVPASQRTSDASVVQSLYSQLLSVANTQFNGVYIFGGASPSSAPYVQSNGGITFAGATGTLKNAVDANTQASINIDGTTVFGGNSTATAGAALSPNLTGSTRLSDLGGALGNGIAKGPIQISDGTSAVTLDLSSASTVQDVVDAINATGLATASISGNHLTLTGSAGATLSVSNVGGGTTASDLGIASAAQPAGTPIVGTPVSPSVTPLTPISSLLGGTGLNTSTGLVISNGATTKTVSLSGATTVQDILNAINGSGTGAKAEINAAGTGISIYNSTQGTSLTVSDAPGGTLAQQLGIRTMTGSTPLASLNGGKGVQTSSAGPDLTITDKSGNAFGVDLTGAVTVQDAINKINAATGGAVTASLNGNGNGILLTDSSGGGGSLTVGSANGTTAATDLGIAGTTTGTTIQGTDVNPVQSNGIFDHISQLMAALQQNDTNAITAAATALQADLANVNAVRGSNGAQLQSISTRTTNLTSQNLTTKTMLSDLTNTDYTTAATKYTFLQTILQANYQVVSDASKMSLMSYLG
jgi:flagellar hook-associated protein 3